MITVWEHMEDFDNAELSHYDWREQLEDAVRTYNAENGTAYDPAETFLSYVNRQPYSEPNE